ncbi:MAG TPA: response regulator transcription factor [Candidatus Acidoferrales bacterium]|jgi:DNA-binding NarL/FixJ family response regulator|nr:response regulator transcription factor [Candidatus Acidoferrales bacterium]
MRTRFLIVDDSDLVRQSLRTVLQANPEWEVSGEASNGADALERFKDSRPNIVIVDFQMPGINGIETARRMMEIAPAVPIVLFTQHASLELEKLALEAGIRKVVSKTDAFPMVGIIEALLGPSDPSPSLEEPSKPEQHESKK